MKHYVCAGSCHGVSDTAKVCDTADCTNVGQPLKECHCADNHHGQVAGGDAAATPANDQG